jgi:hypothetical protein
VAAVLGAAVLFGTTGTAQALGPAATTPLGVGAARLAVGGIALLTVLPLLGHPVREATALWRTRAGLAAGACTALYQLAFFAGVSRAGVALGTLVTIGSGPVLGGPAGTAAARRTARPALARRHGAVRGRARPADAAGQLGRRVRRPARGGAGAGQRAGLRRLHRAGQAAAAQAGRRRLR